MDAENLPYTNEHSQAAHSVAFYPFADEQTANFYWVLRKWTGSVLRYGSVLFLTAFYKHTRKFYRAHRNQIRSLKTCFLFHSLWLFDKKKSAVFYFSFCFVLLEKIRKSKTTTTENYFRRKKTQKKILREKNEKLSVIFSITKIVYHAPRIIKKNRTNISIAK